MRKFIDEEYDEVTELAFADSDGDVQVVMLEGGNISFTYDGCLSQHYLPLQDIDKMIKLLQEAKKEWGQNDNTEAV